MKLSKKTSFILFNFITTIASNAMEQHDRSLMPTTFEITNSARKKLDFSDEAVAEIDYLRPIEEYINGANTKRNREDGDGDQNEEPDTKRQKTDSNTDQNTVTEPDFTNEFYYPDSPYQGPVWDISDIEEYPEDNQLTIEDFQFIILPDINIPVHEIKEIIKNNTNNILPAG